ncbi:MAG: PAS domain S-box-containing protein [Granulosicoccus sp.]|jgi:PAS domain S-box-containing protein
MIENAEAVSQGKQSVVNMFFVYVGISSLLFFFVALLFFIPLMNDSFDVFQEKKSRQSANDYSLKLSVYLESRLLVLNDLASSALITNAVLLGEKNNPALAYFLDAARLLGEDPSLTLVDVNGSVLLTEDMVGGNVDYRWVQPLLEGLSLESSVVPASQLINFIVEDSRGISLKTPLFELAVPVTYGNSRDGVLVARINASPRVVYSADLLKSGVSEVQYSKQKKMIQSDIGSIVLPDKETILIDAYNISFSHFVSRSDVKASKRELWIRLSVGALISSVVMCFGLFFLGRKNILQPYIKLAALQNAVSKAVEGISFVDPSGCYVSLNHAYAGAAGYLPEELEGKSWSVTVHPDDLPMLNEAYQTMLDEGVVTAEARGRRKDGSTFYKQVSMITQYDDKGEMIGHHCLLKDISARKENEKQQEDLIQALARTNSSLVDSQEKILIGEANLQAVLKFQAVIFDNVPDMLFVKDSEFRIVQANQAFLNVYPEDMRDDVIGKTSLEEYDDDEREAFLMFDRVAFDKGFSQTEETIRFPDGRRRTLLTKKVRFKDDLGNVFILGVASDISERKQYQLEREKLIGELAESNEGLEHFAFVCSHDLQEPLRVIRSFSELLQKHIGDSLEGDDKAQLYFKFIVDGAARAQVLIADILAYSRVDNDTQVLESVDSRQLVEAVKQNFQIGVDGDLRKVSCDVLPEVVGNKTQLYQLLQNLINNGLKYQSADKTPEVHVSAVSIGDGYWQFSVQDNGIGIDTRYQKQIFEVFKRLHGQSEYAGTGVGLAICKKVVERHGGRLWVESEKGQGAMFHFTLPKVKG